MRYLPHTQEDIDAMLQAIGMDRLEDLFAMIPEDCRCDDSRLNLPEPLTEWDLNTLMDRLAGTMAVRPQYAMYMGAGSYDHYIPESIAYLLNRSEFVTAYTPYQPEVSQGTLQAIYEFQTLTARLLGMEIANASLYDGASALAEALLMALRLSRRKKVALSPLIHPNYRRVVRTYLEPGDYEIIELPYLESGQTDGSSLASLDGLAAVAIQSPNFFGCIEDLEAIGNIAHQQEALLVACFSEPLAFGLFKNPGSLGADIACGEGQSLGIPPAFGGPGLGMLATGQKHMRSLPGRLVGQTKDLHGQRGFVLTLATREQHIRRERATSNICTNNSLCAVAASMYMASLGGTGMRQLARLNYDKSEYMKNALKKEGFKISHDSPTFNEFVAEFPAGFEKTYQRLLKKGIIAGLPLKTDYPEATGRYLMCVTETKSKADIDHFVREVIS